MASGPSRSEHLDPARAEVLHPVVRCARSLRVLRPADGVGIAARGAKRFATDLGTASSRRAGDPAVARLPWGVWPRAPEVDTTQALAAGLEPALARYAAMLRRRRQGTKAPVVRVLPLLVRRDGGTARGPGTGPGGLARRSAPFDHPVPPLEVRLERDPDEAARQAPTAPPEPPGARPRLAPRSRSSAGATPTPPSASRGRSPRRR